MKFSVTYVTHRSKANTKAALTYMFVGGKPAPTKHDSRVNFEAKTYGEAQKKIHQLILPDDPRPIMGRTNIALYKV